MQKRSPVEIWTSYLRKVELEHSGDVLKEYLRVLGLFRDFLGTDYPTTEKAREYLHRFTHRSKNTQARYTDIINGILDWCGEEKVKRVKTPKRKPSYTPEAEFEAFFTTIGSKKSHKGTIARDTLMFQVMDATGIRCAEVANFNVRDLFLDGRYQKEPYLLVHGKGDKDRLIPLTFEMAQTLRSFVKNKRPDDSVFGLKARSVVNKFYIWKRKAGVSISAHDLRRHFATDLNDLGIDIRTTQEILGHEDVSTTQGYIAMPSKAAREAIERREGHRNPVAAPAMVYRSAHPFRGIGNDAGSSDLWAAVLQTMLDPANLTQALENVEDVRLSELPLLDSVTASRPRRLSK